MLTMDHENERTIHMPNNPHKFVFDTEVSAIFDDMADRSIPMFRTAHAMNARIAGPWMLKGGTEILDIGASRGAFLRALDDLYGIENLDIKATDNSPAMVGYMRSDFPSVTVEQVDITGRGFLQCMNTYDVINCTYVLQFIPVAMQRIVLAKICSMVRKGGVLFMAQKNKDLSPIGSIVHEEYIQWRMSNGYTREEIEAKTQALAGSMWPMSEKVLTEDLRSMGMTEVTRTCSWGPFSNLMCIKR
jgi:tRNA (cmo5U34)-methyltransferase